MLIKEGEIGDTAFLIKEGECNVLSTRNPLQDAIPETISPKKKTDIDLRAVRGYMSHTTTTYQFGILEKNQWAGEERLIKKSDEPFDYTISARTNVKAFVVTKEEANKRFPKEFMDFIEKGVIQRYKWIEERAKKLVINSSRVARMDPLDKKYDENLLNVAKKFPTATKPILNNIRKNDLLGRSLSTKRNIFQQNAVNQLTNVTCAQSQNMSRNDDTLFTSVRKTSVKESVVESQPPSLISSVILKSDKSSERLLQQNNKFKVDNAAGAPIYTNVKAIMPYFTRPLYKSRVASIGMMKMSSTRNSLPYLYSKNDGVEDQKFKIGNRQIRAIHRGANSIRVSTPNAFGYLSARNASLENGCKE